jgi:hypothetical protein
VDESGVTSAGAFERGLNLRTLEPEKAKRW